MEGNWMAEANRISELRMAVALMQTTIQDTPTSVRMGKVLDALERYGKALERRARKYGARWSKRGEVCITDEKRSLPLDGIQIESLPI